MALAIGVLAVITACSLGLRRYKGLMPIGGTSSAIIAAVCWRPSNDTHAALEKVQWGELVDSTESFGPIDDEMEEQAMPVPHLCITSKEVVTPRIGVKYY